MSTAQPPITPLGDQPINDEAVKIDFKINGGYQSYSAEILRISLLAISAVSAVWLKVYLPDVSTHVPVVHPTPSFGTLVLGSFAALSVSAASALWHRYVAA